jgi:hypothetical protein
MAIDMTGDDAQDLADRHGVDEHRDRPDWRSRLQRLSDRLTLAEDASASGPSPVAVAPVTEEPVDADGARSPRAVVQVALSLVAGVAGGLILVGTAPKWWLAPSGWRLELPGLLPGVGASSLYFGSLFLLGVLLLAGGWLGLLGHTSRRLGSGRSRARLVIIAAVLWALPFTVSLPQLSTDVYAYGAQGYAATQGFDPSNVGIDVLPRDSCVFDTRCYWSSTDSIWRKDPAPYGPVGVALSQAAVIVSGYNTYWTTYAFRFLAMAGVVLAGIGVHQIARRRGVDESMALAIAIANPVVMIHLIGGAHNDALMMGLLLVGLSAWERGRKLLSVALVTLAVCVKLPAVLALGYLAWNWWGEHRDDDWRQRARAFPIVGGLSALLIGALCLAVGIRLGWLTALSSTNKVTSTFSFFTKAGFVSSDLLDAADVSHDPWAVTGVFRYIGLAIAAAVMAIVLRHSPRLGVTKSTGIALLALMLLAPVVWPWYLPVTFALLAAVGVRRYRPTLIVLVIASSLLVWPMSVQSIETLSRYQHWLGLLVVLIIAGCCVGAQYLARASERRQTGVSKVPTIEAVLITPAVAAPEPATASAAAGEQTVTPVAGG